VHFVGQNMECKKMHSINNIKKMLNSSTNREKNSIQLSNCTNSVHFITHWLIVMMPKISFWTGKWTFLTLFWCSCSLLHPLSPWVRYLAKKFAALHLLLFNEYNSKEIYRHEYFCTACHSISAPMAINGCTCRSYLPEALFCCLATIWSTKWSMYSTSTVTVNGQW
jgi:hypothetical protein